MDMQREDFLKLWQLPELTYQINNAYYTGTGRTRDGMSFNNQFRVLADWFPQGRIVQLGEIPFISRGPSRNDSKFPRAELILLSAVTLEEKSLTTLEALALAEVLIQEQTK